VALSDACLDCQAGAFTNNGTGSTQCSICDAGTYSTGLTDECSSCRLGRFSGGGATVCSKCLPGSYANAPATKACTACAAGQNQPNFGNVLCVVCSAGKSQPAPAQAECADCEAGKYAPLPGKLECKVCSFGYASEGAAVACTFAAPGYYLASNAASSAVKALVCPKNADCSAGGLTAPVPGKGFWVDHSSYKCVWGALLNDCPLLPLMGFQGLHAQP
jgi:hypothetical protein